MGVASSWEDEEQQELCSHVQQLSTAVIASFPVIASGMLRDIWFQGRQNTTIICASRLKSFSGLMHFILCSFC